MHWTDVYARQIGWVGAAVSVAAFWTVIYYAVRGAARLVLS